jgi:hypothetical protein
MALSLVLTLSSEDERPKPLRLLRADGDGLRLEPLLVPGELSLESLLL